MELENLNAKIILDWDDGEMYISSIQTFDKVSGKEIDLKLTGSTSSTSMPVWDENYKYKVNDITTLDGKLYVSNQNYNMGYNPRKERLWWGEVVDLSTVNAITLEGRSFNELHKEILAGNQITDYYLKTEVDGIILDYFNNVDAKFLNGWDLDTIKNDYTGKIDNLNVLLKKYVADFLKSEADTSYQKELIEYFDSIIM